MGNKRNVRGRRRKFNKAGGAVFQKGRVRQKRTVIGDNSRNAGVNITLKKNAGMNVTWKKLIKKAKKYKCVKDHSSCKLFLKSVEDSVEESRFINMNKLESHIAELSVHAALC